jgi:hypothetical protein
MVIIGVVIIVMVAAYVLFGIEVDRRSPDDVIKGLPEEKYSPGMSILQAIFGSKSAEKRAKLLENLNQEANQRAENQAAQNRLEELRIEAENRKRADQHSAATVELQLKLMKEAEAMGLDLMSYLELKKKMELDKLELDRNWKEWEQDIKGANTAQLEEHQHLELLAGYIEKLYDKSDQLRQKGNLRGHKLMEEYIATLEKDFRERQARLTQTENGQDKERVREEAKSSGRSEREDNKAQDETPPPNRGRRRTGKTSAN